MTAILASGNGYICQVKANCGYLFRTIRRCHQDQKPLDTASMGDNAHGRQTRWQVAVYGVDDASLIVQWPGLTRLVVVEKVVSVKGKTSRSISYRISSNDQLSAADFGGYIRGHWGIENRLHWVKDVHFKEDTNRLNAHSPAVVVSVINTVALNFLRQHVHDSIKKAQVIFGQNLEKHLHLART